MIAIGKVASVNNCSHPDDEIETRTSRIGEMYWIERICMKCGHQLSSIQTNRLPKPGVYTGKMIAGNLVFVPHEAKPKT